MSGKSIFGLALLALVIVGAVIATQVDWDGMKREATAAREPVTVRLFFGGEKAAFLKNEAVTEILRKDYRITLEARKAGSIEMASTLDTSSMDCIWPSNQVAVEIARASGKRVQSDQNIFNSPIVLYAWDAVADALERVGIVSKRDDIYYVVDAPKLVDYIQEGKRWREDLGLPIYGPVKILSTDPRKSNSGNMWAGLLANLLNDGSVVTAEKLPIVLPKVEAYFRTLGHQEGSSGDIFENFLSQGMGSRPVIVGYENQLVEFVLAHPDAAALIRSKIRILYPEPTIFSSHPLIVLQPACNRLVEAFLDPRIQDIAWRDHGFRTGLIGVENDPSLLTVAGIPPSVDLVMPMPRASEMQAIIDALN